MTPPTEVVLEPWRTELRRGLRLLRVGQFDEARGHFERAYRLGPDSPEVCFALGREKLRAGALDDAEPLLRRAWLGDRTLLSAAAYLARCLGLDRGDFTGARRILEEGYQHHGRVPALLIVDAELSLEAGDIDAARQAADEAMACDPTGVSHDAVRAVMARVVHHQGVELADDGQYEAALFYFRRAADLDREWSAPHCNLGAAFERLGRAERAMPAYERALLLDADNLTARFNLARLLRRQGRADEAHAVIEHIDRRNRPED